MPLAQCLVRACSVEVNVTTVLPWLCLGISAFGDGEALKSGHDAYFSGHGSVTCSLRLSCGHDSDAAKATIGSIFADENRSLSQCRIKHRDLFVVSGITCVVQNEKTRVAWDSG